MTRAQSIVYESTQAWANYSAMAMRLLESKECLSLQELIEKLYLDQFNNDTNKRLYASVSFRKDREITWCHRGNVIIGFRKCNTPTDLYDWYKNWFVVEGGRCLADMIKWVERVELEWMGLSEQDIELCELG